MFEKVVNLLFPPSCIICGNGFKNWLCPKCKLLLKEELKYNVIVSNNRSVYFLGFYEKKIKDLILDFKFKDKPYIGKAFSYLILLNDNWKEKLKKYDLILAVPMFNKNKKIRGYNQAEILAKEIGNRTGMQYRKDVLYKIKDNAKQSSLSIHQRKENVKNVYTVKKKETISNKKILLVDDIYTTGNTVKSCINELGLINPKQVDILVIAKTKIEIY